MKNNYFALFIALLFSALTASAQSPYRTFPSGDAAWRMSHIYKGGNNIVYTCNMLVNFGTDTVIGSNTYKTLMYSKDCQPNTGGVGFSDYNVKHGFIREDAAQRRVYVIEPGSTNEPLLYDFTLEAGDTVPPSLNNPYNSLIVTQVDSVMLADGYHRRWAIRDENNGLNDPHVYVIEGIGSTFGPLSTMEMPFESHYNLQCFASMNGTTSAATIYPDSNTGCEVLVSIHGLTAEQGSLEVSPNPSSGIFRFAFNEEVKSASVEVYDVHGKLIMTRTGAGRELMVDISTLQNGIYLARIASGKETITRKLIKK